MLPGLLEAQKALAAELHEDDYPLETAIVYNRALEELQPDTPLRWILVADNPGKKEQLEIQNRYLVGSSGKMAENFFARELGTDFRKQVVIINKTPLHTPKTVQLKALLRIYPAARAICEESQLFMADMALSLHRLFKAPLWITGLSELRPRGLFETWYLRFCGEMKKSDSVLAFNHFSMGSFAGDLKKRRLPNEQTSDAILRIGAENRIRVFGF